MHGEQMSISLEYQIKLPRAQRVGFFQYRASSVRVLKKSWVASGFGLGRCGEIFDRVFPGISGYFVYCHVHLYLIFRVYPVFRVPEIPDDFQN